MSAITFIPSFNSLNESIHLGNWEALHSTFAEIYKTHSRHLFPPETLLESLWFSTVLYLGDFYLLVSFYFAMYSLYLISGLLFWFCDRWRLLSSYKIQLQKYPTNKEYIDCFVNLLQNYLLIIFPLLFFAYPVFSFLGFTSALPLPSLFTFSWQMAFFMICEDIAHYFLHRLLHTPWLYQNIHKVHHLFQTPFGLTASYAHPLEVAILGFGTFLGPLLICPHYSTFYAWVLYRQLEAVITHCGYDLPNIFHLFPLYGGTSVHDFHHKVFLCNYSSRFIFMDILFGTYRKPPKND